MDNDSKLNPWNIKNKLITKDIIESILKEYDINESINSNLLITKIYPLRSSIA